MQPADCYSHATMVMEQQTYRNSHVGQHPATLHSQQTNNLGQHHAALYNNHQDLHNHQNSLHNHHSIHPAAHTHTSAQAQLTCPGRRASGVRKVSTKCAMQVCFSKLRRLVPTIPAGQKISKVALIQHVIDYIADLESEVLHTFPTPNTVAMLSPQAQADHSAMSAMAMGGALPSRTKEIATMAEAEDITTMGGAQSSTTMSGAQPSATRVGTQHVTTTGGVQDNATIMTMGSAQPTATPCRVQGAPSEAQGMQGAGMIGVQDITIGATSDVARPPLACIYEDNVRTAV